MQTNTKPGTCAPDNASTWSAETMTTVKLILAALAALLTMAGVASAPALASEHNYLICQNVGRASGKYKNGKCKEEGGEKEWEAEPIRGKETFGVLGEGGTVKLESSLLKVQCTTSFVAESSLAKGGVSSLGIALAGCKEVGVPECPITSFRLHASGLLYTESVKIEEVILEEVWNKLTLRAGSEVVLGGGVSCKARWQVRGTLRCEMPHGSEMKEAHTLDCKARNSELEVENTELGVAVLATYSGSDKIETSPDYWAID
jgi:hypothetical protein